MVSPGLQTIIEQYLSDYFAAHGDGQLPAIGLYDRMMPIFEKPLLEVTLKACEGNQLKAAKILGLNRNTLRKKIQLYAIKPKQTLLP